MSEPTAPTPAASVGVAIPPSIEPSTATINTIGGTMARASERAVVSPDVRRRNAGAACGRIRAINS